MGPENLFEARERLERNGRWATSAERGPERSRPVRSREVTWRRLSQVTPSQEQ